MTQQLVSRERIEEEVRKAVAETLGCEPDSVQMGSSIMEDLDGQSLDFLDVNFRLEQSFGIKMARHLVLEHVEELFGEGKAINEDGEITEPAVRLLKLRMGEEYPVEAGMLVDELPSLVTPDTFADGVEKILESLPEGNWKCEDGTRIVNAETGDPAPFKSGDDLTIEWLKEVEEREHIFGEDKPGRAEECPSASLCQCVPPERLGSVKGALAEQLRGLAVVRGDLPSEFWDRGPLDSLDGAATAASAVVAKVQEEASLIRQHVPNIESLDVSVEFSGSLDGVSHDGPEGHLVIKLARRFRNGGVDLILHHVFRTAEDRFVFAYMRL